MNRNRLFGVLAFLALAVGTAGGFFIGQREGARRGQVHLALSSELRQQEEEARDRAEQAEQVNSNLIQRLEQAQTELAHCREQFDSLEEVRESVGFVGPVLPEAPQPVQEGLTDRITELECEVASLRERLGGHVATTSKPEPSPTTLDGSPGPSPIATVSKVAELPTPKEQCTALTKKGLRCSRTARSNGKCWQHGG